ncbi:MAG TPA: NAD(P)(+) transhydrogenase (Re/Si-specific) subunit beta, partial [Pyrinomonadaceae bacterium]|nr:NAD(P)(+) transhydrogenase (Re/Si-specific) subunit beta [Pyrinomonadaceae bacterium]
MQTYFIELSYLLASILFILGLKGLSHPETAKRGMHLAEFGMLMAIIGTLLHHEIVTYVWIIAGLAIGSVVGLAMGFWVPMTAMPQRTALSHAFGAFAAALVGVAEYLKGAGHLDTITMSALGFEVMLGSLTTTGSLLAFAKLQGMVRGTPMTYKGQNVFNMLLLAVTIGIFIYLIVNPGSMPLFFTMAGLAFVFGLLLVMPIGSADMPVVMSLLNSYA